MSFVTAVRTCLARYATFSGRASRSEYWWFQLFHLLALALPVAVAALADERQFEGVVWPAVIVVHAGLILPNLAVTVRRLHDRDRSGWNYLWILVPFVGELVLLIWCVQRGTEGDNRFGPDPLGAPGNRISGSGRQ